MTILGHLLALLTLAFYALAAWRLRPWGRRWRAVRVSLAASQVSPGPLGRLVAWLILWILGIPVIRDGFFTELDAHPAKEPV